jgi:hypothetical protein
MFIATPHDPFEPPDRRWLRAGYLIESGQPPSPRHDDTWVGRAFAYRRALAACSDDEDRQRLAGGMPAVAEAHQLYTTARPLARAELEARLLAGESDDAIAAKMALTSAGVAAFHDLFYAVRPRLAAGAYILGVVLGGQAHRGLAPDDHGALLPACGYALGGRAVDDLLDYFRDPPAVPDALDSLDAEALRRLRDKLRVGFHVRVLTTPASALSPAAWLQLRGRLAQARQLSTGADGRAAGPGAVRAALDVAALLSREGAAAAAPPGVVEAAEGYLLADRRPQLAEAGEAGRRGVAVPA